jgi:predicted AlkP superfamily pyrophosphatase or phosphodiesterase
MVEQPRSVLLVMIDGMRPDALMAADAPVMQRLARQGASTLRSRTIMPSVTLPCHTSLFYGVSPQRHGITDNIWHPLARPVPSLFDVVWRAGRSTAMFYNWGELRDMAAPSSLAESYLVSADRTKGDVSDQRTFDRAAAWIRATPDFGFVFAYYGSVDLEGHASGWMSDAYLRRIADADRAVGKLVDAMPDGQGLTIVTADHGGHEKTHGTDSELDMTVPLIVCGKAARAGADLGQTSILDLAPTIAAHLGIARPPEWEGRVLDLAGVRQQH